MHDEVQEAREQRAVDQLESVRRELLFVDKHDKGGEGVHIKDF